MFLLLIFYSFFSSGVIVGARISQYLLEKSRIVSQTNDERNYHVFYEFLAGISDELKQRYGLLEANKYFYLNQVKARQRPSRIYQSNLLIDRKFVFKGRELFNSS